ncbi:substrate-binding domain-containing protein [Cellulomonas fimi]|uniref:Periplasmic binding protein domain-containing protein n=1 Tax=Cellulomonas fimi (strain ATCC 484 / DSM 20113 / JCM 1341 / CCUG 24087 / LMG 16345 / NBRC 15513 / NCIMB 8980 / NCTC 7547 / NRS-133) TaxID=590998 RepID=F4GYI7_CELFA|nr:substrate-binding domain-containing protein [Cellulomonas fimi]AEE47104.1 hypothetical protein Celf_2985 [Cellulomonas fimi ATCC 484]NNH07325.1 substrate-binding domain-containing protein [Cellulomonas fimi]VEH35261.1 Uncharacterised protein [Cellulomonas fimi]
MKITRSTALAVAAGLGLSLGLAACDSSGGSAGAAPSGDAGTDAGETVKMCVLVSDATSSEALGFKDYYTKYIQANYNVEFTYSEELADADAEKRAMENFIASGCQAVISFASGDRPAQLDMAEDAGIYYAVATGTLTDEQYDEFSSYEHYVGAIGPSLDIERQAGYDMARHYVDAGKTKYAIFGAGVPFYIDMHIARTAGMLAALAEEPSTSYAGTKDYDAILGTIMADGTIKLDKFESDVYELTGYLEGWNFGDSAWQASMASVVSSKPEVILAAGTGFAVFGAAVSGSGIEIGDIDAYTDENLQAMEAGTVTYLAGKFTSSIGPIFVATLNAVQGNPIRGAADTALALEQGYWVAESVDDFTAYMAADTVEHPAYDKATLDPFVGPDVTYEDFEDFVAAYSYTDLFL